MIPTGNFKIFLLSEPKKDGSNTTCIVGIPASRKKAAPLQLQLTGYSKLMQETIKNAKQGDEVEVITNQTPFCLIQESDMMLMVKELHQKVKFKRPTLIHCMEVY